MGIYGTALHLHVLIFSLVLLSTRIGPSPTRKPLATAADSDASVTRSRMPSSVRCVPAATAMRFLPLQDPAPNERGLPQCRLHVLRRSGHPPVGPQVVLPPPRSSPSRRPAACLVLRWCGQACREGRGWIMRGGIERIVALRDRIALASESIFIESLSMRTVMLSSKENHCLHQHPWRPVNCHLARAERGQVETEAHNNQA